MPNCFCLYRKGSTEPAILQQVDEELCKHFDQPVDPKFWFAGWYNVIGFIVACKNDCELGSQKLRDEVSKWYNGPNESAHRDHMLTILCYLEAHYTSNAWVEIGRQHA